MQSYLGHLVVLRSMWNINSSRVGIVVGHENPLEDKMLVMWTTEDGIKMRYHLQDALLPVTEESLKKIRRRVCDIK